MSMDENEWTRYLQIAIQQPRRQVASRNSITANLIRWLYKGDINPVTEVDMLCERAIVQIILEAFPEHDLLTEERTL